MTSYVRIMTNYDKRPSSAPQPKRNGAMISIREDVIRIERSRMLLGIHIYCLHAYDGGPGVSDTALNTYCIDELTITFLHRIIEEQEISY